MQTHILGFPSMGKHRELKQALESFWKGETTPGNLRSTAAELKKRHWQIQKEAGLDFVTTGDFSLYDRMLDMTCYLGAIPSRFAGVEDNSLQRYFSLARGNAERNIPALEMTKWFDTNYHYLVPEVEEGTVWQRGEHPVVADTKMARRFGFVPKAAIVGPFTWLALAKAHDGTDKWQRLPEIVAGYVSLLAELSPLCPCIQIEEPILCTDWLPDLAGAQFAAVYAELVAASRVPLILATYFGGLADERLDLALSSGCHILHVDLCRGRGQLDALLERLPAAMSLSLGLVDGRNVWITDYARALTLVERCEVALGGDRVLLASSCSLLHTPVDLDGEEALPASIRSRMAFAVQKCRELVDLRRICTHGNRSLLEDNVQRLLATGAHPDKCVAQVRERVAAISDRLLQRNSPLAERRKAQAWLDLPLLPTTTIGSFPQTAAIRKARLEHRKGLLDKAGYRQAMEAEIAGCIARQEELGLDVLVHGEAERNDMVEYFGQQLAGYCFTENGWVQSYGSRCVKPPVIYGDVYRKRPMTVHWLTYAQSLTSKPVKGMLTGPVTMLCWSFVRDDMARDEVCRQIALAIRDEVQDLEDAGIRIIQVDEAAFREGMPLTKAGAERYLAWAVEAFRLASSGVRDETQIHTHMCYSEFGSILPWIARMDADVLSIESSRSGMELLEAFARYDYQAEVGPGVYDIHSPRIPSVEEMADLLRRALRHIPRERLWVNPDCGLKTRRWEEAYPALQNMVAAARQVRAEL